MRMFPPNRLPKSRVDAQPRRLEAERHPFDCVGIERRTAYVRGRPERYIADHGERFSRCPFIRNHEQHIGICQLQGGRTQWHEKKSKRATIRQTCATSAATRNMTDFQCGGLAWPLY